MSRTMSIEATSTSVPQDVWWRLWRVKVATRVLLGLLWFWEGLGPKLLVVPREELAMVDRTGLWLVSPAATLGFLGVCEMAGGIWLICGRAERLAAALSTIIGSLLGVIVMIHDPPSMVDPYGGLIKDLAVIACGLVIWVMSPIVSTRPHRATEVVL